MEKVTSSSLVGSIFKGCVVNVKAMEYKTDLDKLRHSCSHVLAQAVKELWPETKLAIGPAIEKGFYYDFECSHTFTDEDLKAIEKRMQKIVNKKLPFTMEYQNRGDAIKFFRDRKEDFKVELIEGLADEKVSYYKTGDEFIDLCKGPHVDNTERIKAFKLLSVAGSYWRGDENKPRLQRIYGTAFFSKEDLEEYLKQLEEAEKRDHRKLGVQLDLFNFYHESAGAGMVFYHPAGALLRQTIVDYVIGQHLKRGYDLVSTPHLLKGKLWVQSGHAENYRDNMYFLNVDDEEYAVKPMNCPGHTLIYRSRTRSYRDLPVRFFELGTVYRNEKAGVMHGLLRVRGFTQDDAHIFCRRDQIKDEVMAVIDFVFDVMRDFGFSDLKIEVSTRPEKYIGSLDNWETATSALKESLETKKLAYQINEGDGAFYGPKIDIKLRDAIGREWQCATIQCDFNLPERFDLNYVNEKGEYERPIMLHRAILGSLERFIGTLIEHYAGAFPAWLAPKQVLIIPIRPEHAEYAQAQQKMLAAAGVRVSVDERNESLGKKIREGTVAKIPYLAVIGDKERDQKQLAIRGYRGGDLGTMSVEDFMSRLKDEIENKK